jgi:hypothetical protein
MEKDKDKSKHIPISNVLEKVLEQDLYEKYKKKLGFAPTADYFYQWALISLNESNSDKAISFLISALDIERKHAPTLHLLKSMVVGLSKDFYENGGAEYKQKYDDLDKLTDGIRKKAISIKRKNEKINDEIEQVEEDMKKGFFITKYLKKKHFERQLLILKNQIVENQDKIDIYKREIRKIKKFQKNEEYSKILGTILEICIIPKRYGWVGNKTGVSE